jgi:hypothetical protein
VTQLVLPLHECAAEPLQDATKAITDPAVAESGVEPLHSSTGPTVVGAASTETSCLCVRV